jgi:hypothetical protein
MDFPDLDSLGVLFALILNLILSLSAFLTEPVGSILVSFNVGAAETRACFKGTIDFRPAARSALVLKLSSTNSLRDSSNCLNPLIWNLVIDTLFFVLAMVPPFIYYTA